MRAASPTCICIAAPAGCARVVGGRARGRGSSHSTPVRSPISNERKASMDGRRASRGPAAARGGDFELGGLVSDCSPESIEMERDPLVDGNGSTFGGAPERSRNSLKL